MVAGNSSKSSLMIAGIWLIGLALLIETPWIWPGVLFLAGATALVRAYYHPGSRGFARAGIATILVGVWAILRFSLPALMVGLGVILIVSALLQTTAEAKPVIDRTLD